MIDVLVCCVCMNWHFGSRCQTFLRVVFERVCQWLFMCLLESGQVQFFVFVLLPFIRCSFRGLALPGPCS
jgi:hypothetical protein